MRAALLVLTVGLSVVSSCRCGDPLDEPLLAELDATELCVLLRIGLANWSLLEGHAGRCVPGEPVRWLEDAPDFEEVRARFRAECAPGGGYANEFVDLLANDGVRIDVDRLRACVAGARAVRRGPLEGLRFTEGSALVRLIDGSDCRGVVVPLRAEGDPCTSLHECPAGTWCEAPDPYVAEFRCLRGAEPGESCGAHRSCARGPCPGAGTCPDDPVEGAPCVESLEGASVCAPGLVCAGRVCRTPAAAGAPCEDACVDGLACIEGECRTPPVDGEACSGICADGLRCVDGRCRPPLPPAAIGEPCEGTCADPCARCAPEGSPDARCVLARPAGSPCVWNQDCVFPLVCRAGVCAPDDRRRGSNESCLRDAECRDGLRCVRDRCRGPARAADESCSTNEPCASGLVCVGSDTARKCKAPTPAGGACGANENVVCAAGLYCADDDMCRPTSGIGEACATKEACGEGDCLEGRCTVDAPGAASCVDMRGLLPLFLALGALLSGGRFRFE